MNRHSINSHCLISRTLPKNLGTHIQQAFGLSCAFFFLSLCLFSSISSTRFLYSGNICITFQSMLRLLVAFFCRSECCQFGFDSRIFLISLRRSTILDYEDIFNRKTLPGTHSSDAGKYTVGNYWPFWVLIRSQVASPLIYGTKTIVFYHTSMHHDLRSFLTYLL